jgi:polysaccharide export outer membrane protein
LLYVFVRIIGHALRIAAAWAVVPLATLLALAGAGCATLPGVTDKALRPPPEVARSSLRFQKEYLLFAGDQVEVSVWRNPEVSRTVTIRPDGFISLPLIQELKAAGLTPKELAEGVTKQLSGRLLNPEVTVIPSQTRQASVYVLGDVRTPGAYPARNAVTAAQALALAGGVLRTGGESNTAVIRLSESGFLEAIPIGGDWSITQSGPYITLAAAVLQPDDIVFVPETGRSQISRALNDLLVPYQIYLNYRLIQYTLQ